MKIEAPRLSKSLHDLKPKKYSLSGLADHPQLKADLIRTAIRRVGTNMMEGLMTVRDQNFVLARNRIDIPHGMFTMSYDKFFERRRNDITYLGVMELISEKVLEDARYCVILDDLQEMVGKLACGYNKGKMDPILEELDKANKLLHIHIAIYKEYLNNQAKLKKVMDRLTQFAHEEKRAMVKVDQATCEAADKLRNRRLIKNTAEIRYTQNFTEAFVDQGVLQTETIMANLQAEQDHYFWLTKREITVFDSTETKLQSDIRMLKRKLNEWNEALYNDMDRLSGELAYKTNSIETWQRFTEELTKKMRFMAIDKVRLEEWAENREAEKKAKQRMQALKLFAHKKKKSKN